MVESAAAPQAPSLPPPIEATPAIVAEVRQRFATALERQKVGDADGAIAAYSDLLALCPTVPDAYNNLAVLLKAQNKLPAAIACLKRAVHMLPKSGALYSNLGNMLWMALEFDEAMQCFRRALELDPKRPEIYHNLGLLYFSLGNTQSAIECYERSLALMPGNRLVAWDRALALLASGDYARGFAEYDVRFELDDPSMGFDRQLLQVRTAPLPLWQGEDLAGKTLFVYSEQGLGDTIQFCRFLPLAARRGARIVFNCQADLVRLMGRIEGIAELRDQRAPWPKADYHLPLMSLPRRLGVTLETLPQAPYLAPPAPGEPHLRRPPGTRVAAGIVWAGRPQHMNDHNRSTTLEAMLELADLPGVTLYSLQKGPRADDIGTLRARGLVQDLGPDIQDFLDTARLLCQLDLVVTVDSAVAHLAGALGRQCVLLLPYTADWRWLVARTDTPWYPSLRIFRQSAPRDWKGVLRRVREAIARSLGA